MWREKDKLGINAASSAIKNRPLEIGCPCPKFKTLLSNVKTPTRKASVFLANKNLSPKRIEKELGPEVGPIRLRLGDQEAIFEAGLWIPETGKVGGTFKENEKLKKEVRRLEEENNLLKLKFDVLLDMLTQTTAEAHSQKEELERLKNNFPHNKKVVA